MTVTSGKKKTKNLPRKSAENAKDLTTEGTEVHGSEEQGTYHELKAKAAPELFQVWQQQRVSLDLALQAARALSLTDQALVIHVEDPEGYLRSQILAAKRAEEDPPPAPPQAGGEITAETAVPHSPNEAAESPVVGWTVRMEYVDEADSGDFHFEDYASAREFFADEITAVSARAAFLYEFRADGKFWEIDRASQASPVDGVDGVDKVDSAVGGATPVERAYRGLNWHAPDLLTLHPIAEAYPAMSEVEFAALVEDIRANGQREPVWVDDKGRIVDGRHRWNACKALDNKLVKTGYCSDLGLTTEAELRAFAASQNLHRRHLNESQRALAAAALCAGKTPPAPPQAGGDKGTANLQSRVTVAEAAEKLKVSPRSVATAKKVWEKGSPEVIAAVQAGTVSVSAAARAVDSGQAATDTGDNPAMLKTRMWLLGKRWGYATGLGTTPHFSRSTKTTLFCLYIDDGVVLQCRTLSTGETTTHDFKTPKSAHQFVERMIADEAPKTAYRCGVEDAKATTLLRQAGFIKHKTRTPDKKEREYWYKSSETAEVEIFSGDGCWECTTHVYGYAGTLGGGTCADVSGPYSGLKSAISTALNIYLTRTLADLRRCGVDVAGEDGAAPKEATTEDGPTTEGYPDHYVVSFSMLREADRLEREYPTLQEAEIAFDALSGADHDTTLIRVANGERREIRWCSWRSIGGDGKAPADLPYFTPEDVNQEGFKFDRLCRILTLLQEVGPSSSLEYATPTEVQVDYLVEHLGGALEWLTAVHSAFQGCLQDS